jgi:peroxiredoxin
MAIESTDLPLGTPAPEFSLVDVVTGESVSLASLPASSALLVMFICRHCPYVKHVVPEIGRIASEYAGKGLTILGISSNDAATYPEDAPESLAEMVKLEGWQFPMLYDETQDVARAYAAVCTPEFYVFDASRKLAYHGQLDDSRHKNQVPLSGRDLRAALDAVLSGTPVASPQKPAIGCSIKWKT